MSTTVIQELLGHTFAQVYGEIGGDELRFTDPDGQGFRFYHEQDCCEHVRIVDIVGDLFDLENTSIVEAEEVSSDDAPSLKGVDSYTWTFYRFSTVKGTLTVRWLGESNGFYSESVQFGRVGQCA